jgi:hypothetical protein
VARDDQGKRIGGHRAADGPGGSRSANGRSDLAVRPDLPRRNSRRRTPDSAKEWGEALEIQIYAEDPRMAAPVSMNLQDKIGQDLPAGTG